jgi:hypothetical protein
LAQALDSNEWLCDLFAPFSPRNSAHWFARPPNGGERRTHLMGDELHGVLVANTLGFGAIEATAHDPVLPPLPRSA